MLQHILHVLLLIVSQSHDRLDLHSPSFHKWRLLGKKNKWMPSNVRLCAPDANLVYCNLLDVILHTPINVNRLIVKPGVGHL